MKNPTLIKLRDFGPISPEELNRILRSLISLKKEYNEYTQEIHTYTASIVPGTSLTVKNDILSSIEETVTCGHASCTKRILSIIGDLKTHQEY